LNYRYQIWGQDFKETLLFLTVRGLRVLGSEFKGSGFWVQDSALPLTAEAASLIEKETSALRRLIRGFRVLKTDERGQMSRLYGAAATAFVVVLVLVLVPRLL